MISIRKLLLRKGTGRCALLDCLRGLTVLQMIAYHAIWDLVYIFGMPWGWFGSNAAYIWEQEICWTFILLSGFCAGMSRHLLRRGLTVFGIGAAVTLVTWIAMPENIVVFGVLTLIGSCMLLMALVRPALEKLPAWAGLICSALLFALTKHVNAWMGGYLGLFGQRFLTLPEGMYRSYVTAYFGFEPMSFYSTDYFSLIPWLFLFLCGFFLYRLWGKAVLGIRWRGILPLNVIGRYALEIYVVHQPLIYGILLLWDRFLR